MPLLTSALARDEVVIDWPLQGWKEEILKEAVQRVPGHRVGSKSWPNAAGARSAPTAYENK